MQTTTRRAFLKGALSPDHPDAELLQIEEEICRLIDAWSAAPADASDQELSVTYGVPLRAAEHKFATMPVHTPLGVAAKLRRLRYEMSYRRIENEEPLIETSLQALEAMS